MTSFSTGRIGCIIRTFPSAEAVPWARRFPRVQLVAHGVQRRAYVERGLVRLGFRKALLPPEHKPFEALLGRVVVHGIRNVLVLPGAHVPRSLGLRPEDRSLH